MEKMFEQKWVQELSLCFVLYFMIRFSTDYGNVGFTYVQTIIDELVITAMMIGLAYFNNYVIFPRFQQGRYHQAIGLYVLNISIGVLLHPWIVGAVHRAYCFIAICEVPTFVIPSHTVAGLFVLVTFSAMVLRMARDILVQGAENTDAELKLLQSQLNPHFLFNTLNNLYGLAVQKSPKLPGLLGQLTDLLSYSFQDTLAEKVSVEKELRYLQNYIALEQIRLEDQALISFDITGEVNSHQIAPMLLIVFLENAFKHLGAPKGKKQEVRIVLEIRNDTLHFLCKNSVNKASGPESSLPKYHGIGLKNVQKRLELIYPSRYNLNFQENSTYFTVTLDLPL